MSIMNRRNAILGWAVWQIAKQAMKRKAAGSVPGGGGGRGKRRAATAGVVLGSAALAAGLAYWRKQGRDDDTDVDVT
jgi:hypothetical protein